MCSYVSPVVIVFLEHTHAPYKITKSRKPWLYFAYVFLIYFLVYKRIKQKSETCKRIFLTKWYCVIFLPSYSEPNVPLGLKENTTFAVIIVSSWFVKLHNDHCSVTLKYVQEIKLKVLMHSCSIMLSLLVHWDSTIVFPSQYHSMIQRHHFTCW